MIYITFDSRSFHCIEKNILRRLNHYHHFLEKTLITSVYFPLPACPYGVAGAAAQVGISQHPDLLQLAAIPPLEFQNATRSGLQHNSAIELWVTL